MRTLVTIILLFALSFTVKAAVNLSIEQYGCSNKLAVYATATTAYTSAPLNKWQSSIFAVMWQSSYGNAIITGITPQNGFNYAYSGGVLTWGGGTHFFQAFSFAALNLTFNMTAGQKTLVALIDLSGDILADVKIPASNISGGAGNPPKCSFANISNQHPATYNEVLVSGINLFPGVFWNAGAWCGGTGAAGAPGPGDVALRCYVKSPGAVISANAQVKSLNVKPGADVTVNSFFDIFFEVVLEGTGFMTINPNGSVTAGGPTAMFNPQQIKVLAGPAGVGSFIDNGVITYGGAGSALVQTFLQNAGAVGSYYFHQVGPTVTTTPPGSGVLISAFDLVPQGTYAYFYQESDNSWVNIYDLNTVVPTAKGLILSTIDALNYTINMTGQLVTGPVAIPVAFSGNNIDLISNPYPSSVDFDLLFGGNPIGSTYYIWNPAIGSYQTYTSGVGGPLGDKIVPGQGFFVTTNALAPVVFNNGYRAHAAGPLVKDMTPYMLTLVASGNTFSEYSNIHFMEAATNNYDELYDAKKWASVFPEATEISTVSTDLENLCMNSYPTLGSSMVSVPMTFKCGAEGTYTITATGIESFDQGTEIWLEDIVTGGEWILLSDNPVYEFYSLPVEVQNRFVVHFFGPTGINDPNGASLVRIYGWGQDAYIVNRGNETIREYVAYDMMGRELHRGTLPNNTVNKVTIGDVSAYYVVKVITKEGRIYTDKVYITK